MLLLIRRTMTDVTRWGPFVQLASQGFLPTALQHAVGDHGQFEFVEGTLNAEQDTVLGIGRIIEAMLVGQQYVVVSAKPDQLIPVLIIACQPREFRCGYGDGEERAREWSICGDPEGKETYRKARAAKLGLRIK